MIKHVKFTDPNGSYKKFELKAPEDSGVFVYSIDGLSPETSDLAISKYAGGMFRYGATFPRSRNIKMNLVPRVMDIEQKRRELEGFFIFDKRFRIEFSNEEDDIYLTDGYVESFDTNLFSKTQAFSIGLTCPNPYFYKPSMESEIGESGLTINYNGKVNTGYEIHFHLLSNPGDIEFLGNGALHVNMVKVIDSVGAIASGDVLVYSSSERYLKHIRGSIETYVLSSLTRADPWLYLTPGENIIDFSCTGPRERVTDSSRVFYKEWYTGI